MAESPEMRVSADPKQGNPLDTRSLTKRFLNCSICFEDFNDNKRHPRLLPCLHTYCNTCLCDLIKNESIACPLCRESYSVPNNNGSIFPKDNTRRDLLDFISAKERPSSLLCQMKEDNNPAKYRCKDCSLFLCQDCYILHETITICKDHNVFCINDIECSLENVKEFSHLGLCQSEGHKDEKLKFYCNKNGCEMPICVSCAITGHLATDGHIVKDINDVYLQKLNNLQDEKKNILSKWESVQNVIGCVEKEMMQVDVLCDQSKESAVAAFESCIQILQRRRDAVCEKIETTRHQKQKVLQNQKDNLTSLKESITDACSFLEHALLFRNLPAFLEIAPSIFYRFFSLKNTIIEELPHERAFIKFSLKHMGMEFQKFANEMGRLSTTLAYGPKTTVQLKEPIQTKRETSIAIQLKDHNDLTLEEEDIDVFYEIEDPDGKITRVTEPCTYKNGGYRASCIIEKPGKHNIRIVADGVYLDEVPHEFEAKECIDTTVEDDVDFGLFEAKCSNKEADIYNERPFSKNVMDNSDHKYLSRVPYNAANSDNRETVIEFGNYRRELKQPNPFSIIDGNKGKIEFLKHSEKLDRKKQQMTEIVKVKYHQLRFLMITHFPEKIGKKFEGFVVKLDIKSLEVTFSGLGSEINAVKLEMFETFNKIVSAKVGQFSQDKINFFDSKKVREYLDNKLKRSKIVAVWEIEKQRNVMIYAMSDKESVEASHIFQQSIVETPVSLKPESVYLLQSQLWNENKLQVENIVPGLIKVVPVPDQQKIIVFTTTENVGTCRELVEDFLTFNTVYEKVLCLTPGEMTFLQQHHKNEITSIANDLKDDQVKVYLDNVEIRIKGTSTGLNKAQQRIDGIVKKIVKKQHTFNKPGMAKYIGTEEGQAKLRKVENMKKCTIDSSDSGDSDEFEFVDNPNFSSSQKCQEVATCISSGGRRITVVKGDLTELDVDVIVNAANKDLKHVGGLAKAIVKKGDVTGNIPKYEEEGALDPVSERSVIRPSEEKEPKTKPKKAKGKQKKDPPKSSSEQPLTLTVVIYADSPKTVNEAVKMIEELIEKEFQTKVFEDRIIKEFSPAQKTAVNALVQYGIDVKYEERIGRIQLFGLTADLLNAADSIHKLIREAARNKQAGQEASLVSGMVQWYCIEITKNGTELTPYPKNVNLIIERAYRDSKTKAVFCDNTGTEYTIDFSSYKEFPTKNPADTVEVIRRDLIKDTTFEPPSNWSTMKDKENVTVITLSNTDTEYQTLIQSFKQSSGANFTIVKVERIQNRTLYQQYVAKKKLMDGQNKAGHNNEHTLWHGTAGNAKDSINTYGFNRSYCGKNVTAYGNGVYFEVNASYYCSTAYSPADVSGNRHVYQCKVLTGEYTQGRHGMRVPPAKTNHILYDSVVDNPAHPGMYIIFNDTQAYPEYLITFK